MGDFGTRAALGIPFLMAWFWLTRILSVAGLSLAVHGQTTPPGVGFPHDWPGKPHGDYSPAWQSCERFESRAFSDCLLTDFAPDFQVTKPLPNVTWALPRNFAGNIAVNRPGHPNNTLFFWGFEKDRGSLTTSAHDHGNRPWGIWLNGGCAAYMHIYFNMLTILL